MKTILFCTLFFTTFSEPKINNILFEINAYQMKQFSNPTALTLKMLNKLEFLNRHILQNNFKDSFWLVNVYDNKKCFNTLIISDTNIYFESLKKDSNIISYTKNVAKKCCWDLIDSLEKGKKLPKVYDASMRSMVMKIKGSEKGKIIITGFNLNNLNEKVNQFHF